MEIEGILPKGPYPPCLRMADRALFARYPRNKAILLPFYLPNGMFYTVKMACLYWIMALVVLSCLNSGRISPTLSIIGSHQLKAWGISGEAVAQTALRLIYMGITHNWSNRINHLQNSVPFLSFIRCECKLLKCLFHICNKLYISLYMI